MSEARLAVVSEPNVVAPELLTCLDGQSADAGRATLVAERSNGDGLSTRYP